MINYFKLSDNSKYNLLSVTGFNNYCFKIRGDHKEYDHYRFVANPFASKSFDFVYGVEKNGKYVAQMLSMPGALVLNNEIKPLFWGQDYYVLEENRGEGIGKGLSNYYLEKDYYIAVGFSTKSAIIHQKMGANKIGYLDYFEKWASPFHKIKFLFDRLLKIKSKNVTNYKFPDEVNEFKMIHESKDFHAPNLSWNKNVIETIRNNEYIGWRFFYIKNRYFVYQCINHKKNANASYFVVKPYFYKGVNWLRVVDYRFNNEQTLDFFNILKSAEKIRKQLGLYGVLISSSQKISNDILLKKKFIRTRHEVVLTNYPFIHEESDDTHNHFIITFADSDIDMHTNTGKFNYGKDY